MSIHSSKSQSSPKNFHIDQDSQGNQAIFIPIWQNTDESVNNNQSVLREREQQIRMYKTKIQHLQKHLEDYDRNFQSLYVALNQATTSEKLTKKQLIQQRNVINHLKLQRQSLQVNNKMLGEKVRQGNANQMEMKTRVDVLEREGQLMRVRNQELVRQFGEVGEGLKRRNQQLERQLKEYERIVNQLKSKLMVSQNEHNLTMQKHRKSSQHQLQLMKNQLSLIESQSLSLKNTNHSLQSQLADQRIQLQTFSNQQNSSQIKHKHNNNKIKQLQTQLQTKMQQIDLLNKNIRKLQAQLVRQKKKSANLQNRLKQTQQQLGEINNVGKQSNISKQEISEKLQQMQEQLAEYKQKNTQKDRLIKKLQRQIQSLQQRFKKLSQASIQSKRVVGINKKCQQCQELHLKVRQLQQQLNGMQTKIQDLQMQLRQKQDQLKKANRQMQRLKRQCEKSKKQQQRVSKLIKKHELQIQRLQQEMEGVHQQIDSVKQQLVKQREQKQHRQGELERLRRKNNELGDSNAGSNRQVASFNKDKGKDKLMKENERLRNRVEQLEGERNGGNQEKSVQKSAHKQDYTQCLQELYAEKARIKGLQAEISHLKSQLQKKVKQTANTFASNIRPSRSPQKHPFITSTDSSNYQQQYQQQLQSLRRQLQQKRYSSSSVQYQRMLTQKKDFTQQQHKLLQQQQRLQQLKNISDNVHEYYQGQIRVILRQLQGLKLQNIKLNECVVRLESELSQQMGKNVRLQQQDIKLGNNTNVILNRGVDCLANKLNEVSVQSRLCVNCHLINDQLIHSQQQVSALNQQVYQLRCLNQQYLSTILTYQQTYQLSSMKSHTHIHTTPSTNTHKQLLSQIEYYKLELRKLQSLYNQQQQQLHRLQSQINQQQCYYKAKMMNKQQQIKLLLVRMENMQLHKQNRSYQTSTSNSPSRVLAKEAVMIQTLPINSSCYGGYQQQRRRMFNNSKVMLSKRGERLF